MLFDNDADDDDDDEAAAARSVHKHTHVHRTDSSANEKGTIENVYMCNRNYSTHFEYDDARLHVLNTVVSFICSVGGECKDPKRTALAFVYKCSIYIVPDDATTKLKREIAYKQTRHTHTYTTKRHARSEAAVVKDMWNTRAPTPQYLRRLNKTRGAIFFSLAIHSTRCHRSVVFFQLSRCHSVIGKIVSSSCVCVCCCTWGDTICLLVDDFHVRYFECNEHTSIFSGCSIAIAPQFVMSPISILHCVVTSSVPKLCLCTIVHDRIAYTIVIRQFINGIWWHGIDCVCMCERERAKSSIRSMRAKLRTVQTPVQNKTNR